MQVDYAVGKAKRATAKIGTLIDGRNCLSVQLGIELYKSLVRPHLEYGLPVWANITEKEVSTLAVSYTHLTLATKRIV